jgi:pilus assembly protein CpaC
VVALAALLLGVQPPASTAKEAAPPDALTGATRDLLPSTSEGAEAGAVISLVPGEVQSIPVDAIERVVIGDPNVADVEVVSSTEIFLQAKSVGTTNLLLWDRQGQRTSSVEVVDRIPEAVAAQLRQILNQLNLPHVSAHRENKHLFLTGIVASQDELDRVEQMLTAFGTQVTNLVALRPGPPPPPPAPPPSVKLTVQVIEMTRDGTDKLGVDWADSLTFTETTFGALGPSNVSIPARLGEAFRVGALSRSALTPTFNMLVSQGKARLLAEPKLVAASGKEATTFIGIEVPIITTTSVSSGVVSQSIAFKNTGVELKFKPTVSSGEKLIQLGMSAKVSSVDKSVAITVSGITVPGFRIRQTDTEIVTASGESVFISGLLQDEEKKNLSQVPAIGSIPVLGNLFRSTEFTRGQSELIVIVTPEILGERSAAEEAKETAADRTTILEEALASAELISAVEDPSLRYALQVQDRIAKAIRYPIREQELGFSGRVKVRLHLFRDGTLGQSTVSESSGVEAFDMEALKAAETQAPYPAFPPGLAQPDLWLEVPVLFRP